MHEPLTLQRGRTGHIFIKAHIENGPCLDLLLDSGASQTVIAASSPALEAAKPLATERTTVAEAAGGAVSIVRMVELQTLNIGEWRLSGIRAAVIELAHLAERLDHQVDGILGLDVLSRDGFWLDLAANKLCLSLHNSDYSKTTGRHPYHQIDFRLTEHNLIGLDIYTPSQVRISAVIDFGAAQTLVNRVALEAFGGKPANNDPSRPASGGWGVDACPLSVATAQIGGFQMADFLFPSMLIHVADLPVFEVLEYRDKPIILLGLDIFDRRIVGVDFAARRLYFAPINA